MAIGTPVNRGVAGGTTSATTASFTPSADDLLCVLVGGRDTDALSAAATISDSLGGTWTRVIDANGPNSNPYYTGTLFTQKIGGSPAAMTVTGGVSNATQTVVAVVSFSGAGSTLTNFGSDDDTAGDPAVTLGGSPATGSAVAGFWFGPQTAAVTPVAGFTELFELTGAGAGLTANTRVEFAYDLSSPAQTLSWTSTNGNCLGIVFEVPEPSAGTQTLTPSLFSEGDTFHAAAVSVGTVALLPALLSDGDTFFGPSISAGPITLAPILVVDGDAFYGAVITVGAVGLLPALVVDADSFYAPVIAVGPVALLPPSVSDGDTFYDATVSLGGSSTTLGPSLLSDGDTFFSATVVVGAVLLLPPHIIDADTFFAPALGEGDTVASVVPSHRIAHVLLERREVPAAPELRRASAPEQSPRIAFIKSDGSRLLHVRK